MLRIAVTGGVACGKSLLGTFIQKTGVDVCDADELVHNILSEDERLRKKLVVEFGENISADDGAIDRRKLAEVVFADVSKLDCLTSIIHPLVIERWTKWLLERERGPKGDCENHMACVIAPLLYELSLEDGWDAIICVVSTKKICEMRLRGKDMVNFERRMELQDPP